MRDVGILDGKTAIVTGGGVGIGRGIALALSSEGAAVVVAGRTASTLEETTQEIVVRGGRAAAVVCDITDSDQVDALIAKTVEEFATIDILINNAALVPHGSLLEIPEDLVNAAWAAGPMAAMRLMRRCHPYLKGRGGTIVNVSSGVSKGSTAPNRVAYAMTKSALDSLGRCAAMEWAADGIRVNTIFPLARTLAFDKFEQGEPERAAAAIAGVPLGRIGDPEQDIGRAVVFLVGPDSGYITGHILPLDGGGAHLR